MYWLEMDFGRWRAEQKFAKQLLTDVEADIDGQGYAYVTGKLAWFSPSGHENGPFQVRFVYPHDFPNRGQVPRIYLDGRPADWRGVVDAHVSADWQVCLFVAIESGIDFHRPDSLRDLIAMLPPFLVRQRIFQRRLSAWSERTGPKPVWPGPERLHNLDGYAQALEAHGAMLQDEWCLCGSGRKFGDCHMVSLRDHHARRRGRHVSAGADTCH